MFVSVKGIRDVTKNFIYNNNIINPELFMTYRACP